MASADQGKCFGWCDEPPKIEKIDTDDDDKPKKEPTAKANCWTAFMVSRPGVVVGGVLGLSLLIVLALGSMDPVKLDTGGESFRTISGIVADDNFAFLAGLKATVSPRPRANASAVGLQPKLVMPQSMPKAMLTFVWEALEDGGENLLTTVNIARICAAEEALLKQPSASKFCLKQGPSPLEGGCKAPRSICNFMKPTTSFTVPAPGTNDTKYKFYRPSGSAKYGRCINEAESAGIITLTGCAIPDRRGAALATDALILQAAQTLRDSNDTISKQYFLTTAFLEKKSEKLAVSRSQVYFGYPYSAPLLADEQSLTAADKSVDCAALMTDKSVDHAAGAATDNTCSESVKWLKTNMPTKDSKAADKKTWWQVLECAKVALHKDEECMRSLEGQNVQYTFNIFADGELLPLLEEMDEGKGDYTYGGKSGELRIMWYEYSRLIQAYFDKVVVADGLLSVGAMVFSFLYVWFNTRDWGLTCLGMLHIMLSLPVSLFIYQVVFGYAVFGTLNFLGIFVILGIGADDIFICLDCWQQSKRFVADPEDFEERVFWMWNRASYAMLTTTSTTAAAFFANAISPIPPIRAFGIFTGLLVSVNYLYVISWFPALIVLREKKNAWGYYVMAYCGCCLVCLPLTFSCRKKEVWAKYNAYAAKAASAIKAPKGGEEDDEEVVLEGFLATTFYHKLAPSLRKWKSLLIGVFSLISIVSVILILVLLRPTEDAQQFLPDDNMLQHCLDLENNNPVFATQSVAQVGNLYYGMQGVDRSKTDDLDMSDFGVAQWDASFQAALATPAAQNHAIEGCNKLRASKWIRKVFDPAGEVYCPMEQFKAYILTVRNESFPVSAALFPARLGAFSHYVFSLQRSDLGQTAYIVQAGTKHVDSMRFSKTGDMPIQMMQAIFNLTLQFTDVAAVARPCIDDLEALVTAHNVGAPAGMKAHLTASKFISIVTEEKLLSSAAVGCLLSLILAFFVVLTSTRNIIVTCYSVGSILGVVLTVIAFICGPLGWKLGVIESICITVVVGLSVDYTIHLGHIFSLAAEDPSKDPEQQRFEKAREALASMGVSVFSAAITTLGSALFLCMSYVLFFKRFGIFVVLNILFSTLFAFVGYMAFLMRCGPLAGSGTMCARKGGEAKP